MTTEHISDALRTVKYPGFSRDIVSFGLVKNVSLNGDQAEVTIQVQTTDPKIPEQIYLACQEALHALDSSITYRVNVDVKAPAQTTGTQSTETGQKTGISGVKKIIAIASGKGGVGKSTVTSNLAVALQQQGLKVGICDCDLYGPSIAQMFGATDRQPSANQQDQIIPIQAHGITLMSMGFLLNHDSPVIVRGPLATRYIQQFLRQVEWGELDVLLLDLPPGTGDIQLTIVQTIALDGSIIVTTPQEIALIDARKAISMFSKVNIPILGLVENMAYFLCDHGIKYQIFGEGGGKAEAKKLKIPFLGEIPIEPPVCQAGDLGTPIALANPNLSVTSNAFKQVAEAFSPDLNR
ncbi:MAG: Mrp/NBP35 family ATP-binding protein [Verrucomicrobiota bacterium]